MQGNPSCGTYPAGVPRAAAKRQKSPYTEEPPLAAPPSETARSSKMASKAARSRSTIARRKAQSWQRAWCRALHRNLPRGRAFIDKEKIVSDNWGLGEGG